MTFGPDVGFHREFAGAASAVTDGEPVKYDASEMVRILIVEDEARLADRIARVLGEEGYAAETVADGRSALAGAVTEPFDLLIVDWMLPDLDGVRVVKGLRAAAVGVPVLMLTARDQIEDRVEGLDAGADDYLPKPFAFAELLARVRALARRQPMPADPVRSVADVTLDPTRHSVRRGGEQISLTATEFALLAVLIERPGRVFTRSALLDAVWGGSRETYANVVDLYVSYLRKKLDRPGEPSHIRTVRGVGYAFARGEEG